MTSPAGSISLAQEYLRDTLAASATFQAWVGAASAAAAEASIYQDDLPAPATPPEYTLAELQGYRPMAIIQTDEDGGYLVEQDSAGDGFDFDEHGKLWLCLEGNVSEALANQNAEMLLQFRNTVGQILDDMLALAGTVGYLAMRRVRVFGPFRTHPDKAARQGDAVWVWLHIEWR